MSEQRSDSSIAQPYGSSSCRDALVNSSAHPQALASLLRNAVWAPSDALYLNQEVDEDQR